MIEAIATAERLTNFVSLEDSRKKKQSLANRPSKYSQGKESGTNKGKRAPTKGQAQKARPQNLTDASYAKAGHVSKTNTSLTRLDMCPTMFFLFFIFYFVGHGIWPPYMIHTLNIVLKDICGTKNIEQNKLNI